ncbi:MAG TPA: hypothetical protein VFV73_30440 [Streptosporangiaceae bacterium]|nr:hypothetical protein [Streptosporangiaceae bacterium]
MSSTAFARGSPGHVAAMGAVAVDRPTLFIQGTILVLAFASVLVIAESSHEIGAFTGRAVAAGALATLWLGSSRSRCSAWPATARTRCSSAYRDRRPGSGHALCPRCRQP